MLAIHSAPRHRAAHRLRRVQRRAAHTAPRSACIRFIIGYLELDANMSFSTFGELLAEKPQVHHLAPMRWVLRDWQMGSPYIRHVQTGVLNYVAVRPVTAVLGFALEPLGLYRAGDLSRNNLWVYITLVNSVAQGFAIYALIMLYRATAAELRPIKARHLPPAPPAAHATPVFIRRYPPPPPLPQGLAKFLCVKGIVFATFWQGMLVAIAVRTRLAQRAGLRPIAGDTEADLATRLQNFFICVEMLGFAAAHAYAFSAREFYADGAEPRGGGGALPRMRSLFDLSDVQANVAGQVSRGVGGVRDKAAAAGRGG